jgi:hypothetical protein
MAQLSHFAGRIDTREGSTYRDRVMAAMIRNLICKFQIRQKKLEKEVLVVLMTTFFIYGGDVPS